MNECKYTIQEAAELILEGKYLIKTEPDSEQFGIFCDYLQDSGLELPEYDEELETVYKYAINYRDEFPWLGESSGTCCCYRSPGRAEKDQMLLEQIIFEEEDIESLFNIGKSLW